MVDGQFSFSYALDEYESSEAIFLYININCIAIYGWVGSFNGYAKIEFLLKTALVKKYSLEVFFRGICILFEVIKTADYNKINNTIWIYYQ